MKLRKIVLMTPVLALALSPLASCSNGAGVLGTATPGVSTSSPLASFPAESPSNLRISITDAPSMDLKSVFVNVDHAELLVNSGGANGRLIVAQGLGLVDLMQLRSGVLLPMQDLNLAAGTEITGIRLVLKGDNNYSIKADDSRCEMQTPSGQQSGIKIHLAQPFTLESGASYSMIMDFDAGKSVVVKGNGDCLLKPVLKLLSVQKADDFPIQIVPVTDGTDANVDPVGTPAPGTDTGGFEIPLDPVAQAPIITPQQTF